MERIRFFKTWIVIGILKTIRTSFARTSEKDKGGGIMDEEDFRYCHNDDTDEYHDCLDYMECEECPYYYEDLD